MSKEMQTKVKKTPYPPAYSRTGSRELEYIHSPNFPISPTKIYKFIKVKSYQNKDRKEAKNIEKYLNYKIHQEIKNAVLYGKGSLASILLPEFELDPIGYGVGKLCGLKNSLPNSPART